MNKSTSTVTLKNDTELKKKRPIKFACNSTYFFHIVFRGDLDWQEKILGAT